MNNTFKNAVSGSAITINGTTKTAFVNSINSANIYGVTANITSGNINIIYNAPGPFYLTETDNINKPLATAGIKTGKYGVNSNITIISGTIPNPTFSSSSVFSIGTNWNAILNSLPKSQRRLFKLIHIAQPERQKIGTPSYRILNVYIGTVSPTQGHPWAMSGDIEPILNSTITPLNISLSTSGNTTVAHGLGKTPSAVIIQMTSAGEIWMTGNDSTNLYLTASDTNLTAIIYLITDIITR
jgi:hypothetical protein